MDVDGVGDEAYVTSDEFGDMVTTRSSPARARYRCS